MAFAYVRKNALYLRDITFSCNLYLTSRIVAKWQAQAGANFGAVVRYSVNSMIGRNSPEALRFEITITEMGGSDKEPLWVGAS
jgi:hypothetical protein